MTDSRGGAGGALGRLADGLTDLDPGGVRAALAVKTVVGTVVATLLAVAFSRAIPSLAWPDALAGWTAAAARFDEARRAEEATVLLPVATAVLTLNLFLLVPVAGWGRELGRFAVAAAIVLVLSTAVGLAAPGSWGAGPLPVSLLWILLICAGLYARRWGPVAAKIGLLTAVVGIVFVVTNPTRALGVWLPAAAFIAVATAGVLRFLVLRPSAVTAFRVQGLRFLDAAADAVAAFRDGTAPPPQDAPRAPPARAGETTLRRRWRRLQRALPAALAETPRIAPRLNAQLVAAYRIVLAHDVAADAFRAMPAADRASLLADTRLDAAMGQLGERLDHPAVIAFPSGAELDPGLSAVLEELVDPERGLSAERLQAVRFAIGLRRMERALNDFLAGRSQVEMAALPGATDAGGEAARDAAARTAGRLAVQALLATGITTALQFGLALDHAYWATLTAALVLNGTVGETLVRTLNRGLGTLAGVLLAIALVPLVAAAPALAVGLILAGVFVTVLTIERNYAVASGALGFMVSLGIHLLDDATLSQMASRAYETFIGAGAALAVAWLFFPKYAASGVDDRIAAFLERVAAGLAEVAARAPDRDLTVSAPLVSELQALADEIPVIAAERRLAGRSAEELSALVVLLDALVAYLGQYESTAGVVANETLPTAVRTRLAELDARLAAAMDGLVALARAPRAGPRGTPPAPFEAEGVTTTEIVGPAPEVAPRVMLRVVDHAYAGNRIGRTINDIAAAIGGAGR